MKKVLIIYGSSGGNTEVVCLKVAEVLRLKNVDVLLSRVEQSSPEMIFTSDACVLAAPTYEHGIIQFHFLPFLKGLKQLDLGGHSMAVIGLGDAQYDMHYHIESANTLESAIRNANGSLFVRSLRISGLPFPHLNGRISQWAEQLSQKLLTS